MRKRSLLSAAAALIAVTARAEETAELAETGMETLSTLLPQMKDWSLKLIFCVAVLLLGLLLIRVGRGVIRRTCRGYRERYPDRRVNTDGGETGNPAAAHSSSRTAESLILSIFNYVMYFAIILIILSMIGVDTSSVLTVAGIGGIALSLGSQTLVKDALSGLFLWIDGVVKVGDIISVNGVTGTVENVALRTTALRCTNGNLQVIPNGDIRAVTNLTRDYRCALVDITVSHGQDYRKAIRVMQEAMDRLDQACPLIDEPPHVAGIIATDRFCATVRIESRCRVADCWTLEREIRLYALEALTENGIKP